MYVMHTNLFSQAETDIISELLHLFHDTRYFQFGGKIYKQTKGAPIGGTLSGLISELVLQDVEHKILGSPIPGLVKYSRYVDDVLIIWDTTGQEYQYAPNVCEDQYAPWPVTHTPAQLTPTNVPTSPDELINQVASLRPEISFEKEADLTTSTNYLDLILTITDTGMKIGIYRKPTYSWRIPKWASRTIREHKKSAVIPLLVRAYRLLTDKDILNKELNEIYSRALQRGYPLATLKRWQKEARDISMRPTRNEDTEHNDHTKPTYRRVQNNAQLQSFKNALSKHGVRLVTKKDNTLFGNIRNDAEPRETLKQPGIYCIPLYRNYEGETQERFYIGRTLRQVEERLEEHKRTVRNKEDQTAIAAAATHEGWIPRWQDTKILDRPKTFLRSVMLEYLHIKSAEDNLVNERSTYANLEVWIRANGLCTTETRDRNEY